MHSKLFPFYKISLLLLISFFLGCGSQPDKSKKPEIKAKKVVVKQTKSQAPPKALPQKTDTPKQSGDAAGKENSLEEQDDSSQVSNAEETEEEVADIYDPTGRIDPFAALVKERKFVSVQKEKRQKRALLTPLEKVDLSQLTLSAIILASSGNRAIVTESDGKGYVVTKGTYIGINNGRVSGILIDKIIVEEEVENILGRSSIRKRELKLQKPAGE